MRDMIRIALIALVLAGAFAAPVAAKNFEDGFVAYIVGDYATAIRLWRPLAKRGDPKAQYYLGIIYDNGDGVPQDYVWSCPAVMDGYGFAQRGGSSFRS